MEQTLNSFLSVFSVKDIQKDSMSASETAGHPLLSSVTGSSFLQSLLVRWILVWFPGSQSIPSRDVKGSDCFKIRHVPFKGLN